MSSTGIPLPPPPPIGELGIIALCVMTFVTAIAVLLVSLRMYVRLRSDRGAGWDDWTIVAATVLSVVCFAIGVKAVQAGAGQHFKLVPLQYYDNFSFWSTLNQLPGSISLTLTRISICLFLKRFFVTDSRWKWALNSIAALTVLTLVSWFCVFFAQCRPVGKILYRLSKGTCWPDRVIADIGFYQGGIWSFTDLALAILPVVFLWRIRISKLTKLGICVLMGLGLITAAFSIVRVVLNARLYGIARSGILPDVTWGVGVITIYGFLEIDLAIIAASLPSIMPLLARWRRSRGTTLIPQHNRAPTPKPKRAPRDPFRITGGSSRRDVESRVDGSETHPPFGGNDLKEYPSHDGSDTVLPLNVVELKM